ALAQGRTASTKSLSVRLLINTKAPAALTVQPPNFGTAPGVQSLRVFFDEKIPLDKASAENKDNYMLQSSNGSGLFDRGSEKVMEQEGTPTFELATNSVSIK